MYSAEQSEEGEARQTGLGGSVKGSEPGGGAPKFDSSDGVLILLEPAVCVETMG